MINNQVSVDRRDPTRSLALRNRYSAAITSRWRGLKGIIRKAVIERNVFGLKQSNNETVTLNKSAESMAADTELPQSGAWQFKTDKEKVSQFRNWLSDQIDDGVLERADFDAKGSQYSEKYITTSYEKGVRHADQFLKDKGFSERAIIGGQPEGISASLRIPRHEKELQELFTRNKDLLESLADDVLNASQVTNVQEALAQGLVEGRGPRTIAKMINNRVDKIAVHRGNMIARTEVNRAHNNAALERYGQWGLDQVQGMAEWLTAGDERVCPRCIGMEGTTHKISEAKGLMPLHPLCILSGQTRIDTEDGEKQIKKIDVGDKVLTHKGNYQKVTSTQKNKGYEGEYYQIKAHKEHKVSVTPKHPILTGSGWKEAKELKEDDKIAVKGKRCKRCGEICEYWRETCSKSCSAEDQWDDEEVRKKMEKSISQSSAQMWAEKGGDDEWREKILGPAHKKTKEMGQKGKHHFQKMWEENRDEMLSHVKEIASLGAKARENNYMDGRTGSDHPNWNGGKTKYHKMRSEAKGNWQKNREKALNRDNNVCQNCGIGKGHASLHVHHIRPVKSGGNNLIDNLVTLCQSCHVTLENKKISMVRKKLGFVSGGANKQPIALTDISEINKKETGQPLTRWNLSVHNDESYVAGRIVVHNCRCTWTPIIRGDDGVEIQENRPNFNELKKYPNWYRRD